MEVSEERADYAEFVSRVDEEIGLTRSSADFAACLLRGIFERADGGGADGDDAAICGAGPGDLVGSFGGDRIGLGVQRVIFNLLDVDGLEGTQADVKRDLGGFDPALPELREDVGSEMKAGGGCGNGAALVRVNGLVAVAIVRGIRTGDVGREGDMADLVDCGKEIVDWREADVALTEFAAGNDFGAEFIVGSEEKMLADGDFAAGADEAFPVIGIVLQLFCEEDFDASAEEVAGGRIVRAQGLGLQTSTAAIEAGGKDASVVEDDEVCGAKQAGEVAEIEMFDGSVEGGKMQKSRGGAVGERLLGDQFVRKFVVKI